MTDEVSPSEKLRDFLSEYFRENERLVIANPSTHLRDNIQNFAKQKGLEVPSLNYDDVTSALWNMALERIIRPVFDERYGSFPELVSFRRTEYGARLLEGVPIDRPNQYLDYLKSQVSDIDSRIVVYLQESLQAYNLGLYFSSSVMLGVASEALFEILIDAYINAIQSSTEQTKFSNKVSGRGISQQYDEFKKKLPDLVGKNGITGRDDHSTRRLREEFKHAMEITFDLIRSYRDYAAHPRDGVVPRHIIKGNLDAFPLFCQRMYEVIEWLQLNKI